MPGAKRTLDPPAECLRCGRVARQHGRGLCTRCYPVARREDELHLYPPLPTIGDRVREEWPHMVNLLGPEAAVARLMAAYGITEHSVLRYLRKMPATV